MFLHAQKNNPLLQQQLIVTVLVLQLKIMLEVEGAELQQVGVHPICCCNLSYAYLFFFF